MILDIPNQSLSNMQPTMSIMKLTACWWLPPSPLEEDQTGQYPGFMWRHSKWQLSEECICGTTRKNVAAWRQYLPEDCLSPRTTVTIFTYRGRHPYCVCHPDLHAREWCGSCITVAIPVRHLLCFFLYLTWIQVTTHAFKVYEANGRNFFMLKTYTGMMSWTDSKTAFTRMLSPLRYNVERHHSGLNTWTC